VFASGHTVVQFREDTIMDQLLTLSDDDWIMPCVLNNCGFKCVQYLGTKLIFVLIVRSIATYSLNLKVVPEIL